MRFRFQPVILSVGMRDYLGWYHLREEFVGGPKPWSRYGGILGDRLGLAGEIDPAIVQQVFLGRNPHDDGPFLDLEARERTNLGYEILVCPPKDLAFVDPLDERIAGCCSDALEVGLTEFETFAARRAALSADHKRTLPTRSLSWALILHLLNRDHALSLHLHCLLASLTHHAGDDRMYALDTLFFRERFGDLVRACKCELAYRIRACGYDTSVDSGGTLRLDDIPRVWIDRASTRSRSIRSAAEALLDDLVDSSASSLVPHKAVANYAAQLTRRPKRPSERALEEVLIGHIGPDGRARLVETVSRARSRTPRPAPRPEDVERAVKAVRDRAVRGGCSQVRRLAFFCEVATALEYSVSLRTLRPIIRELFPQKNPFVDRLDLCSNGIPFPGVSLARPRIPRTHELSAEDAALRHRTVWDKPGASLFHFRPEVPTIAEDFPSPRGVDAIARAVWRSAELKPLPILLAGATSDETVTAADRLRVHLRAQGLLQGPVRQFSMGVSRTASEYKDGIAVGDEVAIGSREPFWEPHRVFVAEEKTPDGLRVSPITGLAAKAPGMRETPKRKVRSAQPESRVLPPNIVPQEVWRRSPVGIQKNDLVSPLVPYSLTTDERLVRISPKHVLVVEKVSATGFALKGVGQIPAHDAHLWTLAWVRNRQVPGMRMMTSSLEDFGIERGANIAAMPPPSSNIGGLAAAGAVDPVCDVLLREQLGSPVVEYTGPETLDQYLRPDAAKPSGAPASAPAERNAEEPKPPSTQAAPALFAGQPEETAESEQPGSPAVEPEDPDGSLVATDEAGRRDLLGRIKSAEPSAKAEQPPQPDASAAENPHPAAPSINGSPRPQAPSHPPKPSAGSEKPANPAPTDQGSAGKDVPNKPGDDDKPAGDSPGGVDMSM